MNKIAEVLNQMADLLELADANIFEVRAYRNASHAVDVSAVEMYEIVERQGKKELEKISGIGESIADNIAELIYTGKLKKLDQLKKKIPRVQVQMLAVPGLGPKLTKKLYAILKPKTLTDLKRKLKDPQYLPKLAKISLLKKTVDKILTGIAVLQSASSRMLLSEALPLAESIVAQLKRLPEVKEVKYAGSLRRGKETIGDIDLVAKIQDKIQISNFKSQSLSRAKLINHNSNLKIIKYFLELTRPKQILAQGESKVTVINNDGAQIDLEIMPGNEWGSLLHHFTGSKEHNIQMRAYAEKKGLSFSEHGFKKLKIKNPKLKTITKNLKLINKILIYCETEEKVFKTLGLQYIPPDLREGTNEIQLAIAKKIPKLLEPSDMRGDLQMHSNYSDGKNTILAMAESAKAMGYEYICISDHSAGLGITGGIGGNNYQKYLAEIKNANQKIRGLHIFSGIEVNIKSDGALDQPDDLLKKFDVVLGAVHNSLGQEKKQMTARIVKALSHPLVKILVHPSGRLIDKRPEIQVDWRAIFQTAQKNKKILEINACPKRLDLKDIYIRKAKNLGAKFAISTDAHSARQLDFMKYGILTARRGWLVKQDVINVLPLAGLKKLFDIK